MRACVGRASAAEGASVNGPELKGPGLRRGGRAARLVAGGVYPTSLEPSRAEFLLVLRRLSCVLPAALANATWN